ncbi:MAG: hypothetical protein IBX63_03380 [Coriobacteriia bacterium]|nr:hypothetical protein [Coriobacteriia bacterium]
MYRKTLTLLALGVAGLMLAGCTQAEPVTEPETNEPDEPAVEQVVQPTKDNPMVVDEENGAILVYAEVNRKWVTEPTRHGVVCANGSNGEKAIFRAGGDALEFNEALFALGAEAGENVKKDSPAGTTVEGDELDITIAWDGNEYPIGDLVVSTGELGGQSLAPKFGGNYEFQSEAKTGCLFCLDSCAAGITSNANVGWKSFDSGKVEFRGDGDKLPADGTSVVITFALK